MSIRLLIVELVHFDLENTVREQKRSQPLSKMTTSATFSLLRRTSSLRQNSLAYASRRYLANYVSQYGPDVAQPTAIFGLVQVPERYAYIVERFGRFHRKLEPGLRFIIPIVDRIAYFHSLKEETVNIPDQQAITSDNVSIEMNGVLYVKIEDPIRASYGVENPYKAVTLLAQTTMRSELGKLDLDRTFKERETLNAKIVEAINDAAHSWGMKCLRYEIRDIEPPNHIKTAMEKQAEAERQKRADILRSEGEKQAEVNIAEAQKRSTVLASEGSKARLINHATGEADAILAKATATARAIENVAAAIERSGGRDALTLRVAEQFIAAFEEIAKESNTMIIPANAADVSSMISQAMGIYKTLGGKKHNVASSERSE